MGLLIQPVHFSFLPPDSTAYRDKDVYLFGQLTDYAFTDSTKMQFNPEKGVYETSLFLKQGYYDYCYVSIDATSNKKIPIFNFTEGNYWESENEYTILVYYRPLAGRADELVGYSRVNSLTGRQGISR